MKQFLWLLILIFCFNALTFIELGQSSFHYYKEKYKRAVDAGADAAAEYDYYVKEENLEQQALGFGEGYESRHNYRIEPDTSLEWFYRVFFRNMSCETDLNKQQELKKTFVFKALVLYDRLLIADHEDTWVVEKRYEVEHGGKGYYLTLSDQVQEKGTGVWVRETSMGLTSLSRKALVSRFIREELNSFIKLNKNIKSGLDYSMHIGLEDMDYRHEGIGGVNIIIMCEGIAIRGFNPWSSQKYYAFSAVGSEISFTK